MYYKKYFNNSSLAKNILYNLFFNIWQAGLLLILIPIYIKILGLESFGLIAFYLIWVTILGVLETGFSSTILREFSWFAAKRKKIIKIFHLFRSAEIFYFSLIFFICLIFGVLVFLFGKEFFKSNTLNSEIIHQTLILMIFSLACSSPLGLYVGGLRGLNKHQQCSFLLALFATIRGLGCVIVLLYIKSDIRIFFIFLIIINSTQLLTFRWLLLRSFTKCDYFNKFSLNPLKPIKNYFTGIIFCTAIAIILSQSDKLILSRIVTLEDFSLYTISWTVASALSLLVSPIISVYSPKITALISNKENKALIKNFKLLSQLTNILTLSPAVVLIFFSKQALFVWTGNPFISDNAAPILSVLVIGMLLINCSYPSLTLLYSKNKIKEIIILNLISLIFIPFQIFAIKYYGLAGAAYIWLFYGITFNISCQAICQKYLSNINFYLFNFYNFIIPFCVVFIINFISSYFINNFNEKFEIIIIIIFNLFISWLILLLLCKDLLNVVKKNFFKK
jgi:O-antigen/teichoic acid export membrane protein